MNTGKADGRTDLRLIGLPVIDTLVKLYHGGVSGNGRSMSCDGCGIVRYLLFNAGEPLCWSCLGTRDRLSHERNPWLTKD